MNAELQMLEDLERYLRECAEQAQHRAGRLRSRRFVRARNEHLGRSGAFLHSAFKVSQVAKKLQEAAAHAATSGGL